MNKCAYSCTVYVGNMSIVETEMQKKAITAFLRSFLIKPHVVKVKCGESSQTDYYYSADVSYEASYLRVLRFSESLHAFCLFWRMSLEEHYMTYLDS